MGGQYAPLKEKGMEPCSRDIGWNPCSRGLPMCCQRVVPSCTQKVVGDMMDFGPREHSMPMADAVTIVSPMNTCIVLCVFPCTYFSSLES